MIRCTVLLFYLIMSGVTGLKAQSPAPFVQNSISLADLEKLAVVYICNAKSEKEEEDASGRFNNSFGEYNNYGVRYSELSKEQYEILCDRFFLPRDSETTMFVVYFNNKAAQFPLYAANTDLSQELNKLGWKPLGERLEDFLKANPYNQDAIARLFALKKRELDFAHAPVPPGVISYFKKAIEMVNKAENLDWMDSIDVLVQLAHIGWPDEYEALKNDPEFQKQIAKFLQLIEAEIIRNPYKSQHYFHWATIANMALNPDPGKILYQTHFPPARRPVNTNFSILADPLFRNDKVEEGFKLLQDIEEWMQVQNIYGGTDFNEALESVATQKIVYLVINKRFNELQDYLNQLILQFSSEWPQFAKKIKNRVSFQLHNGHEIDLQKIPNVDVINALFDSEGVKQNRRYNGLFLTHNISKDFYDKLMIEISRANPYVFLNPDVGLPQNAWSLYNGNSLLASGAIVPSEEGRPESVSEDAKELLGILLREARANLTTLDTFIQRNPDCHIAKQMYCQEASMYLPDEELEAKLYNYTQISRLPITLETYSKILNKERWSRLASRMITEGLVKLRDTPIGYGTNPWQNLSNWEDLDTSRNSVDWYGFLKETEFWCHPMYFVQHFVMPEVVFVKTLRQAEKANDWDTVLDACKTRFSRKTSCKNEWILNIWAQAEEKLSKQ